MVLTRVEIHKLLHQQFEQGKKAVAAARDINALIGRDEVNARTAQRWFQLFRQGRVTITHKKGAGRPVTVNRRVLRRRFKRDRTQSAEELSQRLCHPTTARRWLRSLGRKWRRGRYIPHELTPAQKKNRVDTCQELLRRHRQGRLLSRIITCDECWVYYDGRVKRCQWLLPNEPAQPTPIRSGNAKKRMLCFFWSMQGPVFWELLPRATTINSDLYCSQLDRANTAAQVMTVQGRRKGRVVFQQDDALRAYFQSDHQPYLEGAWLGSATSPALQPRHFAFRLPCFSGAEELPPGPAIPERRGTRKCSAGVHRVQTRHILLRARDPQAAGKMEDCGLAAGRTHY